MGYRAEVIEFISPEHTAFCAALWEKYKLQDSQPYTPWKVGQDIVTVIKVKNTSAGAISLLKVDEYWYDKKLNVVTGDSQPYRKPFNPGEIIEVTLKSPIKPNVELYRSQYQYSHANGDIKVKAVKKFD